MLEHIPSDINKNLRPTQFRGRLAVQDISKKIIEPTQPCIFFKATTCLAQNVAEVITKQETAILHESK